MSQQKFVMQRAGCDPRGTFMLDPNLSAVFQRGVFVMIKDISACINSLCVLWLCRMGADLRSQSFAGGEHAFIID